MIICHLHESTFEVASRDLKMARSALESGQADRVILLGRSRDGERSFTVLSKGLERILLPRPLAKLPVGKFFGFLKTVAAYWQYYKELLKIRPDVIHCHGLFALFPAVMAGLRLSVPVIYDAHELETERFGLSGINQWFDRKLERILIRYCWSVLVVNDAIGDWYRQRYPGVEPTVIRNVPNLSTAKSVGRSLMVSSNSSNGILFLYQGVLSPGRRLEQLLRIFKFRTGRHLLAVVGYGELKEQVEAAAAQSSNIVYLPAVPPDELLEITAQADVGIVGVEAVCESYRLCLPNKFFEYVLAGLPVISPDYPELSRLIGAFRCGWVVSGESDERWAEAIESLTPEIVQQIKAGAVKMREEFTWDREWAKLKEVYASMKPA